jgi:hypothetical protein
MKAVHRPWQVVWSSASWWSCQQIKTLARRSVAGGVVFCLLVVLPVDEGPARRSVAGVVISGLLVVLPADEGPARRSAAGVAIFGLLVVLPADEGPLHGARRQVVWFDGEAGPFFHIGPACVHSFYYNLCLGDQRPQPCRGPPSRRWARGHAAAARTRPRCRALKKKMVAQKSRDKRVSRGGGWGSKTQV